MKVDKDKDGSALSVVRAKKSSQVKNQAGQRVWEN